jgi:membrane associated rhomboid family serine protease
MANSDKPLNGTREPILNSPPVVTWTIAILGAVHLARQFISPDADASLVASLGIVPARYFGGLQVEPSALPGLWALIVPLLSYSVLHGDGIFHYGINAVWLLAIGTPIARRTGPVRFLLFFAVTAVLAAAFYIVLRPTSTAPMIGASGAISALFGALARFIPLRGQPAAAGGVLVDRRVLAFAAVWLLINTATGIIGLADGSINPVAWEAHAGGFLAGLLLFPLFDRHGQP